VTALIDAADMALGANAPPRIRGEVAAARASNRLQTGRLSAALEAADRSLAVGDPASPWVPIPHGVRAHALRWSGDAEGAREAFGDWLRESEARGQVLGVVCSHAEIAVIDVEAGDLVAAAGRAERALVHGYPRFAEHWVSLGAHVALAQLAHAEGDAVRAAREAERSVELARRGGVPGDRANALVAAAGLLGDADLLTEARALLEHAPDPGAMVLRRLAAAERRLGAAPAPARGDDLSEREMGVLRLLATDLTQREIGDALYVSLNTVKTHTRHIFRKLDATGRGDAVRRARAQGLLG
jgi:LuxR family maltose regulon positive regulatory protein